MYTYNEKSLKVADRRAKSKRGVSECCIHNGRKKASQVSRHLRSCDGHTSTNQLCVAGPHCSWVQKTHTKSRLSQSPVDDPHPEPRFIEAGTQKSSQRTDKKFMALAKCDVQACVSVLCRCLGSTFFGCFAARTPFYVLWMSERTSVIQKRSEKNPASVKLVYSGATHTLTTHQHCSNFYG